MDILMSISCRIPLHKFTKYPSKNTNKSCINISLQPSIILIWQVKLLIKQIQAQLKYNKLNTLSMGF